MKPNLEVFALLESTQTNKSIEFELCRIIELFVSKNQKLVYLRIKFLGSKVTTFKK